MNARLVVELDHLTKKGLMVYCESNGHSLRFVVTEIVKKFLEETKKKGSKNAKQKK